MDVHDPDFNFVVNLSGRAQLFLRDAETMKRVWDQIADKSRAYFMNATIDSSGFAVIHTKVELTECTFPKRVLSLIIDPQEFVAVPGA